MTSYEFILIYMVPVDGNIDAYLDRLTKAKCDDAITSLAENGRLTLDFERDGESVFDLINEAISSIAAIIPEAKLVEASPDLVGLSEIAAALEISRQAARKMWESNISNDFPAPVKFGNGKSPLWNMASVIYWMSKSKRYSIPEGLLAVSNAAMKMNLITSMWKLESLGTSIDSTPTSSALNPPEVVPSIPSPDDSLLACQDAENPSLWVVPLTPAVQPQGTLLCS